MEDVGTYMYLMDTWSILRSLLYFMDIWYSLWKFGIVCGNLVYFFRFGILHEEKSGNPEPIQSE
jgi:hypothetical protein